jgi:hypothetical protein
MAIAAPTKAHGRNTQGRGEVMGWILLEALVALLIAIGIVWWTMRGRRKEPARNQHPDPGSDS